MKTLYLVRHAKSSWKDASLADIDRPLNKRGLRDAPFMGTLLKGRGVEPDRLVSSPANRALSTAKFFAASLDYPKEAIDEVADIYEADSSTIFRVVRDFDNAWSTVLLFGHNPTFTTVANRFGDEYIANVPTCGIVRVDADIASWKDFSEKSGELTAFYYPSQYFS